MSDNLPALSSPFPTEFAPIDRYPHIVGGTAYKFHFPNGFGASVIPNVGFALNGDPKGLWELAVLEDAGGSWTLTYNTIVTEDVLPGLSAQEVAEKLAVIARLDADGRLPLLEGDKPALKEDYRIEWEHDHDFEPEQGGVMVTVMVKRRLALAKFEDGTVYDADVWVEVDAILSEVMNPWDSEQIEDVMRYNYPQAFEDGE